MFALDPTPKRNLIWERRIPPQSEFIVTKFGWKSWRIGSHPVLRDWLAIRYITQFGPHHHHHNNNSGLSRTSGFATGKNKGFIYRILWIRTCLRLRKLLKVATISTTIYIIKKRKPDLEGPSELTSEWRERERERERRRVRKKSFEGETERIREEKRKRCLMGKVDLSEDEGINLIAKQITVEKFAKHQLKPRKNYWYGIFRI